MGTQEAAKFLDEATIKEIDDKTQIPLPEPDPSQASFVEDSDQPAYTYVDSQPDMSQNLTSQIEYSHSPTLLSQQQMSKEGRGPSHAYDKNGSA